MSSEKMPENVKFVKICEKNGYCVMKIQATDALDKKAPESKISVEKSSFPSLILRKQRTHEVSRRGHSKKKKTGLVCKEITFTTRDNDDK